MFCPAAGGSSFSRNLRIWLPSCRKSHLRKCSSSLQESSPPVFAFACQSTAFHYTFQYRQRGPLLSFSIRKYKLPLFHSSNLYVYISLYIVQSWQRLPILFSFAQLLYFCVVIFLRYRRDGKRQSVFQCSCNFFHGSAFSTSSNYINFLVISEILLIYVLC
jgi:hypothetical protein